MPRGKISTTLVVSAMVGLLSIAACSQKRPLAPSDGGDGADMKGRGAEFRRELLEVVPGIHVAIGYGLGNSILIEGNDGLIIVDAMESAEAAAPVRRAFEQISRKPVKALIYTHFHPDHLGGGRVMAGGDNPEVICHAETVVQLTHIAMITRDTTYRRAMRQFGSLLPEGELIDAGIGPRLVYDQSKTFAPLPPTKTFDGDRLELEVAGVKLVLLHAPGESPDQTVVWLPEPKVLLPADNFYNSFPNLYAIRGTAYRNAMVWVESLDRMRMLGAEILLPLHSRPVVGAGKVYETLTDYRDAIQFVHDQTIRGMNQGLTPQELVERVKLPAHLAAQPYLKERYGTVAWSVRAIFEGYLGWFGGNATDLLPLPRQARAERFAALAGGGNALMDHARKALGAGDNQWAMELADQLIQLDPESAEARRIKGDALRALGESQTTATARNYCLTQSLEVQGKLSIGKAPEITDLRLIHALPLSSIFEGMSVRLDPEKSADVDTVAGFRFPDTGEVYTVHVRRGVAEIAPRFPENPDIVMTVDASVWKEMVAGVRNPSLVLGRYMKKEGGTLNIMRFLDLFR